MNQQQKIIVEKLNRSLKVCVMHIQRMNHAISCIEHLFPLSVEASSKLSQEDIQALDQFLYRFIKLQDELGGKTFRLLLLSLQEDIEGKPFLEILSRMEQLGILENEETWITLRELRNELTHEYPEMQMDNILGLNSLFLHIQDIINIYKLIDELARKYNLLIA